MRHNNLLEFYQDLERPDDFGRGQGSGFSQAGKRGNGGYGMGCTWSAGAYWGNGSGTSDSEGSPDKGSGHGRGEGSYSGEFDVTVRFGDSLYTLTGVEGGSG